jgi:MoaA/NifB/PqqE/SkfB family radical SAM enzyme
VSPLDLEPRPALDGTASPAAGFLLDAALPTLALEGPGDALRLVDADGATVARFSGAPARALRARLAGEPAAVPAVVSAALAHAPALARALARPALRLAPATLLQRGRWHQLFVELTATCNERCAHCYADAAPERREALDRATAEAVIDEAAALAFEVVQLTGGEALLVPFVADLARRARDRGVAVVEVYTNGVLLTAERYAPLRAAGVAFAFSLYAADPAVHDRVTGLPGSHARTVAAIGRALDGGSEVRVGVIATRPEDEAEARAAAALVRALGLPPERVRLEVARRVGRGEFAGREPEDPANAHAYGPGPGPGPDDEAAERAPGGKAAVLPDRDGGGWVVPCIFSRRLRLGRVGPEGGLRAALERPAARLAPERCVDACGPLRAELTCGECRLVAALLRPASAGPGEDPS